MLQSEGPRVYVVGSRGISGYDLTAPGGDVGPHWWREGGPVARTLDASANLDLLLTQDFALLYEVSTNDGRRVTPFGRQLVPDKGYESGLIRSDFVVAPASMDGPPADATELTVLDGGIATLATDGTLRLHAGAGS